MDSRAPSDDELLNAWADGDCRAGSDLVDRHFARVNRFFRNKVGAELEDLVQQTFLGCVEARGRYEKRSSFVTFLLSIARHQLFNHYRAHRRVTFDEVTSTRLIDSGTSPVGTLAKRDEERLLARALQQLPLDSQVILELAYWEELDGPEIAVVLDLPVNTVYTRLRRARDALREILRSLAPDHADRAAAWRFLSVGAPARS